MLYACYIKALFYLIAEKMKKNRINITSAVIGLVIYLRTMGLLRFN